MIQIHTKKTIDPKHIPSTLVVIVHKKNKKIEAIGADRDMATLIDSLLSEDVKFSDLKKGVFFRSVSSGTFKHLLIVGVDEKYSEIENVRKLAAIILQQIKSQKVATAGVIFEGIAKGFKQIGDVAQAFAEGLQLAAYEFDSFKTKMTPENSHEKDSHKKDNGEETRKEFKVESVDLIIGKKLNANAIAKGLEIGGLLATTVNFARDLGNTPGNLMTPELLAAAAVHAAKGTKLKVTVWDKARIKKEKMGGLLGVSLGSAVDPRFIIMEYNGAAKSKKPVCFVGKGLTFDSGGISIKPAGGMEEMKFDKCGGTCVIATLLAIAKLKLKVNAIGLVPSTENMPGPLANKPGDILTARNGKTVEVDNTDAEGRLILMDALSYASELKPAAIFDAATLTGACVVALGNSYTGCFTRDKKVRKSVNAAAEKSGEAVWHMPINDDHVTDMKGTYADLNNISSFRGGGSSTAAAFLEQFVDKDIPWAHFDIAGTAWHVGNRLNYCSKKGASGVMIRTFVELVKLYS